MLYLLVVLVTRAKSTLVCSSVVALRVQKKNKEKIKIISEGHSSVVPCCDVCRKGRQRLLLNNALLPIKHHFLLFRTFPDVFRAFLEQAACCVRFLPGDWSMSDAIAQQEAKPKKIFICEQKNHPTP
jgi:hypothetical protein